MTITPTPNWTRAMQHAMPGGLKPTRRVDGTYRVCSTSQPGTFHIVTLDDAGQITRCSDCKGWERYGRHNPCKHAAAVAIARAYEMGASIAPQRDSVVYGDRSRSQLMREAAA